MRFFLTIVLALFSLLGEARSTVESSKGKFSISASRQVLKSTKFKRKTTRTKFKILKINHAETPVFESLEEEFLEDFESVSNVFRPSFASFDTKFAFLEGLKHNIFSIDFRGDFHDSVKLPPKI